LSERRVLTIKLPNVIDLAMRIVFMGTPKFAIPALNEIVKQGHIVAAVYTRAPKPGGRRGLKTSKSPVHEAAEALDIPVLTPYTFRDGESLQRFKRHAADVGVVVAYGLLLPAEILGAPRLGCVNLHASLLPRWRGAAPIQRAIMAGDRETGVDLMRMEAGLDTGPVAIREVLPIRPQDSAGDLSLRLSEAAAGVAARGLRDLETGKLTFLPQATVGVSYAHKIRKDEAEIDWTRSAGEIRSHVHGLSPTPGAFSLVSIANRLERLKVLRVETVGAVGAPGTIVDDDLTVACGQGAIRIIEGQRPGGAVKPGRQIMHRASLAVGARFRLPERPESGSRAPA
jgi:methionyl-tRNA formyltransferase